ncbi:MAG: hypothetical protein U0790_01065 [Isosphaeraceae bacterium]
MTGKKCPLSNDVVKTYSFLAYKARDGRPVRPALIARRTGLERGRSGERTGKARGVPRHLEALIAEGLARQAEGGYEAIGTDRRSAGVVRLEAGRGRGLAPAARHLQSIHDRTGGQAQGGGRGGPADPIGQRPVLPDGVVRPLGGKAPRPDSGGPGRLARREPPDVAAGLDLLLKLDLVNPKGHGFALGYPSVETLELWRDRKEATARKGPRSEARPAASEPVYDLAEIVRQSLEGRGRKDDIEAAIPAILAHRQTLANARYTDEDITKLLIGTLPLFPGLSEIWFYFQTGAFLDAFTRAEAEHRAKAKRPGRPSVDLLIYKVREVARQVRC